MSLAHVEEMDSSEMTSSYSLLRTFKFVRLLALGEGGRTLNILGTAGKFDQPAVLLLQQAAFDPDLLKDPSTAFTDHKDLGSNDIYRWLVCNLATEAKVADVKMTLICPATDVHIRKYSAFRTIMVRETPELYAAVVKPWMDSLPADRLKWVYNILDHVSETEHTVYDDPDEESGFIITPDLKWDQKTLSALYLQTIVRPRNIRSMRDLRKHHLPMLKKIREQGERAACGKYGVKPGEVRMIIHYPPSYYHLHVHILHVDLFGRSVGQASLLDDVIDNLEMEARTQWGPEKSYYGERTFSYGLSETHDTFMGLTNRTPATANQTSEEVTAPASEEQGTDRDV